MKLLHTSDWHVGKTIRGISRIKEQTAVLQEIADIAQKEAVDVVLIPGDLFDSAAPSPEAEAIVWKALLALRNTGAEVVVLAGNHDSATSFEAIRPVFAEVGITVIGHVCSAEQGAVKEITTKSGELLRLAILPFCSQRYAIKAAQLMELSSADISNKYEDRFRQIIETLTVDFDADADAVNVIMSHCTVVNGKLGGGEREAQTIFEYAINAAAFPLSTNYIALGHLHRMQSIAGPCPIWYCGSPIHVDFGEENDEKSVLLVETAVSQPAKITPIKLMSPRGLQTLRGSLTDLTELANTTGDDFLRIFVRENARVGLADEVRELFPLAVDVIVDSEAGASESEELRESRSSRTPNELFASFLAERSISDERLQLLFADVHDEVTTAQ